MINLKIVGIDKLQGALKKFPTQIMQALGQAGEEVANDVVFPTEGLQQYPPEGPGNAPPTPYYIRGRGTEYGEGNKGESERYGTQFYAETYETKTTLGNRSSYAPYLTDEKLQAGHMARLGWRKLVDVVNEKLPQIAAVYQKWVNKVIRDLGL